MVMPIVIRKRLIQVEIPSRLSPVTPAPLKLFLLNSGILPRQHIVQGSCLLQLLLIPVCAPYVGTHFYWRVVKQHEVLTQFFC